VSTGDKKEGAGSANFEADVMAYLSIPDASLSSKFPLKNGDTTKSITVSTWVRLETLPKLYDLYTVWGKWSEVANQRSLRLAVTNLPTGCRFSLSIGYLAGHADSFELPTLDVQPGRWYHVGVTYRDSDASYRLRVWDDTARTVVEVAGNAAQRTDTTDAPWEIGRMTGWQGPAAYLDGLVDELVVFKSVLTAAEIDQIRQAIYTKAKK